MNLETKALRGLRLKALGDALDDEICAIWSKLSQWYRLAKSAEADTTEHEVAAGFVLQELRLRGVEISGATSELADAARARCQLAERLALLPERIVLSEGHVELRRHDCGELGVASTAEPLQCAAAARGALDEAGVPVSRSQHGPAPGADAIPLYDVALVRAPQTRKASAAHEYLTKVERGGGAMLSLAVADPAVAALRAAGIVSDPGVASDRLHVTLLYLGDAASLDEAARSAILERSRAVCAEHPLQRMTIAGAGYFAPGPDGTPVYLIATAPGLELLRADLARAIGGLIVLPGQHGWVPHVTLGYWPADTAPPLPDLRGLELPGWTAHFVQAWFGDEELAGILPLAGQAPAADPAWARPAEPEATTAAVRIACSADDKQIVYYLVSEPDTVDAHGHRISAATVEDALHGYMAGPREVKLEHGQNQGLVHTLGRKTLKGKAIVVEGYVAPQDLTEFHGVRPPDGPIARGSSIVGIHYTDLGLWEQLKATDHGISWGGYARKVTR